MIGGGQPEDGDACRPEGAAPGVVRGKVGAASKDPDFASLLAPQPGEVIAATIAPAAGRREEVLPVKETLSHGVKVGDAGQTGAARLSTARLMFCGDSLAYLIFLYIRRAPNFRRYEHATRRLRNKLPYGAGKIPACGDVFSSGGWLPALSGWGGWRGRRGVRLWMRAALF